MDGLVARFERWGLLEPAGGGSTSSVGAGGALAGLDQTPAPPFAQAAPVAHGVHAVATQVRAVFTAAQVALAKVYAKLQLAVEAFLHSVAPFVDVGMVQSKLGELRDAVAGVIGGGSEGDIAAAGSALDGATVDVNLHVEEARARRLSLRRLEYTAAKAAGRPAWPRGAGFARAAAAGRRVVGHV